MGNIEIKTSQNVSIEFETATALERTIAFLIDFAIMVTTFFILVGVMAANASGSSLSFLMILVYVLLIFIFFGSIIIQEILLGGRSVGKIALGIKIIKTNGREATPNDFFIRWGFKLIDVTMSWGFFAMFVISSSKRGQRLGDVVANTTVIKLKPSNKVSLAELLKMHTEAPDVGITYPQAIRINDEYALAIKHVIDRYGKYKNETTSQIIKDLAEKLKLELQIEIKEKSYLQFLKNFLADYVRLTR